MVKKIKQQIPAISGKVQPEISGPMNAMRNMLHDLTGDKSQLVSKSDLVASGVVETSPSGALMQPAFQLMGAHTGLVATGAFAAIILNWDSVSWTNYAYTEIHRSTINDIGTAALIGSTSSSVFSDTPPNNATTVTYYYWIRAVNTGGVAGAFNNTTGTAGSTANDPSYALDVLTGQIAESQLAASLNTRISLIDTPTTGLVDKVAQEITDRQNAIANLQMDVAANLQTSQDWLAGATKGMGAINPRIALYTSTVKYGVFEDGTNIYVNDAVLGTTGAYENLAAGSVGTFSVVAGDKITSNKPVALKYNQDTLGVNLAPLTAAGQRFITTYGRTGTYPTVLTMYAPYSDANIELKIDSGDFTTPDQTVTILAGQVGTLSISTGVNYHVRSNAPIILTRRSTGTSADASLVPPVQTEIMMLLAGGSQIDVDNTTVPAPTYPQGLWSHTKPFMTFRAADGVGGDGEHGIPVTWFGDTYMIPHNLNSYRLGAVEPCTVTVHNNGTLLTTHDMTVGQDGVNPTSKTNPALVEAGSQTGGTGTTIGSGYFVFSGDAPFAIRCDDALSDEYYPIGYRKDVRVNLIQDAAASALVAQETQQRIDGDNAMTQITQGLQASVDANAAALTTEQTTRASADTALASDITALDARLTTNEGTTAGQATAITSLQTDVAQDGTNITANTTAINSLDAQVNDANTGLAKAHANISSEAATRATADTALASDITVMKASQDGNIVTNPELDNWGAVPASWAVWAATPVETTGEFDGSAARFNVGAANAGIRASSITSVPNHESVMVEIKFKLDSGALSGSGIIWRWRDASALLQEKTVKLKDLVASPELGKWYTVTALLKRTVTASTFTYFEMYLMANYSALGAMTAKDITFDYVRVRPATETDLKAEIVKQDLVTTNNNVSANATSITSLDTRLTTAEGDVSGQATAISNLETTVNNSSTGVVATATKVNQLSVTVDAQNALDVITTANVVMDGNTATCIAGTAWVESFRSNNAYRGGAHVSWKCPTVAQSFVGLTTDPASNNSYNTIDYAWYRHPTLVQVRSNGATLASFSNTSLNESFVVEYDGTEVRWLLNGVVKHTLSVAADLLLYMDSSFNGINSPITDIKFIPMTSVAGVSAAIQTEATVRASETGAIQAERTVKLDVNGKVIGTGLISDGPGNASDDFVVAADKFIVVKPGAGGTGTPPFVVDATTGNVYIKAASIQDASITNAKIASLAVDSANIADAAIVNAKIADAAITNAKIANLAVGSAKIADAAITNAKIKDLSVDTLKIGVNAATVVVSGTGTSSAAASISVGYAATLQVLAFTTMSVSGTIRLQKWASSGYVDVQTAYLNSGSTAVLAHVQAVSPGTTYWRLLGVSATRIVVFASMR